MIKIYFRKFPLTENKIFSLSDSSKTVVGKIDDRLTMKVYFSDNLPGEYGNNRRYLQDILEEYVAYSGGNIHFEFHHPDDNEKMQEDAQKSGIQPVQLQVIENDKLVSFEKVTGNENGITEVRATINLLSKGELHTKSDYLQNGKWVDGHEIYYKEAPDAKVLFK